MAWVPITVKEYHLFFGKFVNVAARPKDVERKDWKIYWQKFEIVNDHGMILSVEWHLMDQPKLKYDFQHPRGYFRFDKNLIEEAKPKIAIEVLPPKPETEPRSTIQDRYNPKARFYEMIRKLQADEKKLPSGSPSVPEESDPKSQAELLEKYRLSLRDP